MKTSKLMLIIGAAALLSACSRPESGNSSDEQPKAERNESGSEREDGEEREEAREEEAMERFVNSRDHAINETLRERYIDFSFEYPSNWRSIPQGPAARESNFAQLRAPRRRGSDTINIAFGTAGFNNMENASPQEFEQLIEHLGNDMGRAWRNYRLVSHGRQQLGRHDTWGWTFTTEFDGADGEPMRTHGRADIYLPEGRSSGLYVVTIVTENAEEMPEPQEIGQSGELRRIFNSLSFDEPRRGERTGRSRGRADDERGAGDDSELEPR